jgi:hypothetical protein
MRARGRRHLRRRIPSWPEFTDVFSFMPTVDSRACPARKRRVNRRVEWSGGRRSPGWHLDDRRGHMPNALRIGLLGPLQVRDTTGRLVSLGGRQLRVLSTLLALNAGRVVSAASIAEQIWPEALPGNPGNALQTLVSRLRAELCLAGFGQRDRVASGRLSPCGAARSGRRDGLRGARGPGPPRARRRRRRAGPHGYCERRCSPGGARLSPTRPGATLRTWPRRG